MENILPLIPLFFLVALLYSSVGHGGASGYLAILVLAGFARPSIAPTVLLLNILVAGIGFLSYYRAGHFKFPLLLPFILTSIPAAWLGGTLHLPAPIFSQILGLTLLIASLRFLIVPLAIPPHRLPDPKIVYGLGLPLGAGLGFLSGLVGIGGGIFLSPLLLLLGWANPKQTAAVSSAFIILNSLSGLAAHTLRSSLDLPLFLPLAVAVVAGGVLGSRSGALTLSPRFLQRALGAVLLVASFKLF